jgi:L-ribulokinase
MQIYADVTGREIRVAATGQAGAFGSAMFAAVAAGQEAGGYDSIFEAAKNMARLQDVVYRPNPAHKAVYDQLYAEYLKLHNHFGRGENDVMKRLKALRQQVLAGH